jgi:trigger factor
VVELKVEYTEESSVRKALSFEVEPETLDGEIEDRARDLSRKIRLPGFRPGKVPLSVVKSRFQPQLVEEAVEKIVNRIVPEELRGRGVSPVGPPTIKDLEVNPGAPLKFRACFETLPLIELPEFKGIEVTARAADVADEEIAHELEELRERAGRFEPVEGRPIAEGDYALTDLKWTIKESGESHHDEGALLHVGAEANHPDLNAALIGMSPGEGRSLTAGFPQDGPEAVAGKTVEYELSVKGIKRRVLPELDDEMAKDLGEFESLEALRTAVRDRLATKKRREVDAEIEKALVDEIIARSSFEVPEVLVERHMDERTRQLARGLAVRGIDPEKVDLDWRELRNGQRDAAVRAARAEILLDEIARREGIEALPAEIDAEIAQMASHINVPKDALRARMEQEGEIPGLAGEIRARKTIDMIKANARMNRS